MKVSRYGPNRRGHSVKVLVVVTVVSLLAVLPPAFADSDGVPPPPDIVVDEIPRFEAETVTDAWEMSGIIEAPIAFTMIGFGAAEAVELQARVGGDEWSDWFTLPFLEDDDGPDDGSEEQESAERTQDGIAYTEPAWVGEADRVQIRVVGGSVTDVKASIIDGDGVSRGLFQRAGDVFRPRLKPSPAEASTPLNVISRREWGADESKRNGEPRYIDNVRFGMVHHTAHTSSGANSYSKSQALAIMRSMYAYHTDTLGWNDLGYNIVVDRFGRIYEGRAGGLGRGVMGAHAAGFNSESFGVAIMGNFQSEQPSSAARKALIDVFAWKMHVHDIEPNRNITVRSRGSGKYPSGTNVTLNTIAAHRETGYTACPGAAFYNTFSTLRSDIAKAAKPDLPSHGFPDVSSSHYFDRAVSWLKANDITDGYGTTNRYEPAMAVTRGQMAAFIWRMAGRPTGYPHHGFPDVSSSDFYDAAVRWMKAEGITDGVGNTGKFEPNRPVKRGEMATFLWRYVGEPTGDPGHGFPDVSSSDYFNQPVRWMKANGITDGYGNTGDYKPGRDVSRGQMAAMLYRLASTPPAWRASGQLSPYTLF